MAPLKWGCRGVMGVWGVGYYGSSKDDMEGTPTWDNTYQMKKSIPHLLYGKHYAGLAHIGGGKAVLFELE